MLGVWDCIFDFRVEGLGFRVPNLGLQASGLGTESLSGFASRTSCWGNYGRFDRKHNGVPSSGSP